MVNGFRVVQTQNGSVKLLLQSGDDVATQLLPYLLAVTNPHVSHAKLGGKLGVTGPAVTAWLGGHRGLSVARMYDACTALGYDLLVTAVPRRSAR